ncbi:hypothetical protein D910_02207 [Dendroctonus ponderosae]|uniref:Integrator complex subunit 7 n=1 Tax=Dendroctonus ponderosae TaxID=77166 RepID=U4TVF2_DENPD|nr:hypothetical protein D910_02207 [Dendroctonus ponderosae]
MTTLYKYSSDHNIRDKDNNNFLRLCVLRVCQQSEKHLDKISNVDEFVRRVYSVIHSNDPIARAVTLRTFGAVAAIIPERQQIHHSIRRSLDSHDNVEVEAAIYAAIQFAAQSKTFAVSMCNKVSYMIQGQATTANMKLQLIPILQYMHHDTATAAMVRTLCVDLLPCYPAQDFVLIILNTLSKLAAATLVHIPNQVTLLLKYLKTDPRWEVKSKALQHLYELAIPGAHIWPQGAVDDLIDYVLSRNYTIVICEALGAIGGLKPETLLPQLQTMLKLLGCLRAIESPTDVQTNTKVMLCTLLFQLLSGYKWNEETKNAVFETQLTEQVSSEHFHFWLACLKEMSEAEALLSDEDSSTLVTRLDQSSIHYNKAIAALKCLAQLIYTCNILCIVPPPAIAATIVQNTRDEHQRYGYITNQMRKCVKDFKNCGELHWKLYQTAFDADPVTLENMQILQQMCVLIEQSLETVCTSGSKIREGPMEFGTKNIKLESRELVKACENSLKGAQKLAEDSVTSTITHRQVEILKKIVEILANARLPVPRFFFQILQSTSVKLAISPQPRVMGEFISVQSGSQLAVKVEGVIQHGLKAGLFRNIEQVVISVTSQLQSAAKNKDIDPKVVLEHVSLLSQTVTPHKDFFSAQFLLGFPRGGQYLIVVEASVIDKESNTWKTGPKSSLTVKVPEEPKFLPITVPGITTNSNMILMPEDSLFIKPHQKKLQ